MPSQPARGQPSETHELGDRLNKYLADVHSIEEQALTQLRRAPGIAGDAILAGVFERHLGETERQEDRVRGALERRGGDPSKLKDLAGKAGGLGMIAFAKLNPDTPGKLTAHAFSYEHLEIAAYELLEAAAARAGDRATMAMARDIAAEERLMAHRLSGAFDLAADVSLRDIDQDQLGEQLDKYLVDVHAIEMQGVQMLQAAPSLVDHEELSSVFEEHLAESRVHARRVEARLNARGADPSGFQDAGMRIGALNLAGFFAAQPDTTPKLAGFAFAFEHLEIAAYHLLERVAGHAGDPDTVEIAAEILGDERRAATRLEGLFAKVMDAELSPV
jgi:ferritin-like metal-binding protein YciE